MTSTGIDKARSSNQRIADNTIDITKQIIEDTKVFSSTSPEFALGGSPGSSEGSAAGNYLAKSGDIRLGPMGNEFKIVEIIDNEISVSIATANYVPWIVLNPEGGLPDDLETIIPGESVFLNQELFIQAGNITNSITFKNSSNIITPDGLDLIINFGEVVKLVYSQLLSAWVVSWFSSNVGGGGGGVSFPIDFPEDDRGTVGASTQDILFTDSDRHSVKMVITGDVQLSFSSPPTNETAYTNIIIVQDGTGGHTLTLPVGTINKDVVEAGFLTGIDEETGIVVKFAFGVFYAFLETGNVVSGGGGADQWSTFPAIQTVSMATNGMTELTIAGIVDVGSVARGSISGDATLGLVASLVSGGKFSILDVITPIATFDDSVGLTIEGTHVINMNKNIINTVGQIQLDKTVAFSPTIETGISFDNTLSALNYNVGFTSDVHTFRAAGELLASITRIGSNLGQIQASALIANNTLQATELLFLGSFNNTTPSNGDIWRDSGDGEFKFRQNGVTETLGGEFFGPWTATHDAGGQLLDNIGGINSDAVFLPASGKIKLGNNELIAWVKTDNVSIVEFGLGPTDLLGITGGNLSLTGNDIVDVNLLEGRSSNPLNINIPTAAQLLNFQFGGITEWNMSNQTLTGDNIVLGNTLIINNSSTLPLADGMFSRDGDTLGLQIPTFQLQRATTGTSFGDFNLTKVDAAPSGGEPIYKINFNLFDSPTSITYAQIEGGIEDVTDAGTLGFNVRADGVSNVNALLIEGSLSTSSRTFVSLNAESRIGSDLKFQAPTGSTDLKIFPQLNQLGIVVQDNAAFTVGTLGTNAIPISGILPTTAVQADGFFGDHKGAEGMFDNGSGTLTKFIRQADGNWGSEAGWTRDALT